MSGRRDRSAAGPLPFPRKARFAQRSLQCDNISMPKTLFATANILVLSISFFGTARAQQSAAPASQQSPATKAAQSPPAKSQQAPAKKPAQGPATKTQKPLTLKTEKDKESYAIGMNYGASLRKQSVEVDPDILVRGLRDSLAGGKTLLTEDEERTVLTVLQNEIQKKREDANMEFLAA